MITPADPIAGLSDGELLARVATQDVAAFGEFYDRHIAAASALSLRTVGGRQRADDVCQEAFLSVWRSAGRFDATLGNPRTWLLAVVRNRAIDHLRKARRTRERELVDDALAEHHAAAAADGTEATALRHAAATETRALLARLSHDQRQAIELAFYGGYTHIEIAERLGLPLGTVKARINRGLTRMRTGLTTAGTA